MDLQQKKPIACLSCTINLQPQNESAVARMNSIVWENKHMEEVINIGLEVKR